MPTNFKSEAHLNRNGHDYVSLPDSRHPEWVSCRNCMTMYNTTSQVPCKGKAKLRPMELAVVAQEQNR